MSKKKVKEEKKTEAIDIKKAEPEEYYGFVGETVQEEFYEEKNSNPSTPLQEEMKKELVDLEKSEKTEKKETRGRKKKTEKKDDFAGEIGFVCESIPMIRKMLGVEKEVNPVYMSMLKSGLLQCAEKYNITELPYVAETTLIISVSLIAYDTYISMPKEREKVEK